MTGSTSPDAAARYGARPVSVDIARGRRLVETSPTDNVSSPSPPVRFAPNHQSIADRLSLAHWPRGHEIIVCGLAGGTGRTTLAGLLATVLAELPFAHVWPPIALVEASPRALSSTPRRWGLVEDSEAESASTTRSGAWMLPEVHTKAHRQAFSAVIVDAPAGMPGDLSCIQDDPHASIVLLTRPDRTSLAEAADALVWMNDRASVTRNRAVVVINRGTGESDRGSRAAATALGIRCAAIHSLPYSPTLGPGRALPSGRDLPIRLRRLLAHTALDIWSAATKRPSETASLA